VGYNIQQPAIPNAEDKWTAAEHVGNLLLFFPTEVRRQVKTTNGDADAVACSRVVNLDTGRILTNTLIFGTALVPNIGGGAPDGVVLGRLGQGEGKPGQSKPWILLPHDENELGIAQAWLARDAQGQLQQPAGPPTPPAQAAWGQQAAAPAYGSPAPATAGWGAPAPAAAAAAPQAGWGAPAPAAPAWGAAAAATPPPAPAAPAGPAPDVHPQLVEALRKKGVPGDQLTSMAQAEQIWAVVQHQPDVTA
jgi:hypothetical protein